GRWCRSTRSACTRTSCSRWTCSGASTSPCGTTGTGSAPLVAPRGRSSPVDRVDRFGIAGDVDPVVVLRSVDLACDLEGDHAQPHVLGGHVVDAEDRSPHAAGAGEVLVRGAVVLVAGAVDQAVRFGEDRVVHAA